MPSSDYKYMPGEDSIIRFVSLDTAILGRPEDGWSIGRAVGYLLFIVCGGVIGGVVYAKSKKYHFSGYAGSIIGFGLLAFVITMGIVKIPVVPTKMPASYGPK